MTEFLAVVTDLFFQSRIGSAAHAAGNTVRFVQDADDLPAVLPPFALVDLDARTDVEAIIRRLKSGGTRSVVAFGPHLDTAGRKAARAAGADRVLAKSKFVVELPHLMSDLSAGSSPDARR